MAPQRGADAASVVPYPFVVRQERIAPSQPSSATGSDSVTASSDPDRARPLKGRKKPKPRPVVDEEIRFNTGPRILRPQQQAQASNTRAPRRGFRFPGRSYAEDQAGVPDYPPPSFQEAIRTPPLSVSPSTVSLVPLAVPHVYNQNIAESQRAPTSEAHVDPQAQQSLADSVTGDTTEADDTASISDDSLCIIDPRAELPAGDALTSRVHNDWRARRGREFPGRTVPKSTPPALSLDTATATSLQRRQLIDPQNTGGHDPLGNLSPTSTTKRRFLSLAPLRTMFPPKSPVHEERSMSAHPTPGASPYSEHPSSSRATFFRSTSSLATPFLPLMPTHRAGLSRRLFSTKAKERGPPEDIGAWEVLDDEAYETDPHLVEGREHPASLMSAMARVRALNESGPTRSQSFTFGTPVSPRQGAQPAQLSRGGVINSAAVPASPARDWKGPSSAFIDRQLHRPSASPSVTSFGSEISTSTPTDACAAAPSVVLAPVRLRPTTPTPGISLAHKHTAVVAHSSPLRADLRPRLEVSQPETGGMALYQRALETPLPVTPIHRSQFSEDDAHGLRDHVPASSKNSAIDAPFLARTSPQLTLAVQHHLYVPPSASSINLLDEPMTPNRHHYTGRPLPRPPPTPPRSVGEHAYAPSLTTVNSPPGASCAEGLLIDLEDTTLDDIPPSGASTPGFAASSASIMSHNSTSSSVDLVGQPQGFSTPRAGSPGFSNLTDLDLLVSSLADSPPDGRDYDTLLLLSELIGPATPPRGEAAPSPAAAAAPTNAPLLGRIEVARRRTTATGRVKVKLALLGAAVDTCGVCLAQFRGGDAAARVPLCGHAFHEACLARWLARARTCPICRVDLASSPRTCT